MRAAVAALLVLAILPTAGSGSASPSNSLLLGSGALPRATADRPDEVSGSQIHVAYAVPSDGQDRALDTNGAVAASVAAWNDWLAGQTGGPRLRLDTSGGQLDVTFVRLLETDAQIRARHAFVRDELESLLQTGGFRQANKLWLVYYDGSSDFACGGGAWPPTLPGWVAAQYLKGEPPGAPPCASNQLTPGGRPGYVEFGALHEVLHTMGFVASCARHHTRAGHVSDLANDLMWAGDAPWQLPPGLDIGHDDYWQSGRSDCADLSLSPYLASSTAPAPPRVVRYTATKRAVAGRPFQATLDVDGPILGSTCRAVLRGSRLRARITRRTDGVTCSWAIPRSGAGRRLSGSIAVHAAGGDLSRSFARVVR